MVKFICFWCFEVLTVVTAIGTGKVIIDEFDSSTLWIIALVAGTVLTCTMWYWLFYMVDWATAMS